MTTTQISTRAAIIRHAIINAERNHKDTTNRFTHACLIEQHGLENVAEAGFANADEFVALVELCAEAIDTARAC